MDIYEIVAGCIGGLVVVIGVWARHIWKTEGMVIDHEHIDED